MDTHTHTQSRWQVYFRIWKILSVSSFLSLKSQDGSYDDDDERADSLGCYVLYYISEVVVVVVAEMCDVPLSFGPIIQVSIYAAAVYKQL